MGKNYSITFIGAGKVAWHLAPALENAGHTVEWVYSRKSKNTRELIQRLYNAHAWHSYDFSESDTDIYFLTVPDEAIEEVASQIKIPENAILVHTSGGQPLTKVKTKKSRKAGVFYPLQTFTKEGLVEFDSVPVCVESNHKETYKTLEALAESISEYVYKVDSEKRQALHVAAVIACNFTNYMYQIAGDILHREKLDFKLLHNLIATSVNNALEYGPEKVQTGPASRGDVETLDHHLDYLEYNENYWQLYKLISQQMLDKSYLD